MTRIVLCGDVVASLMAKMDKLDNPLLVLEFDKNELFISIDHDHGTVECNGLVTHLLPTDFGTPH